MVLVADLSNGAHVRCRPRIRHSHRQAFRVDGGPLRVAVRVEVVRVRGDYVLHIVTYRVSDFLDGLYCSVSPATWSARPSSGLPPLASAKGCSSQSPSPSCWHTAAAAAYCPATWTAFHHRPLPASRVPSPRHRQAARLQGRHSRSTPGPSHPRQPGRAQPS